MTAKSWVTILLCLMGVQLIFLYVTLHSANRNSVSPAMVWRTWVSGHMERQDSGEVSVNRKSVLYSGHTWRTTIRSLSGSSTTLQQSIASTPSPTVNAGSLRQTRNISDLNLAESGGNATSNLRNASKSESATSGVIKTLSNSSTHAYTHSPSHNSNSTLTPAIKSPSSQKPTSSDNTWKNGSFCHEFFENTFQIAAPVCANSSAPPSVECFGSPHSHSMGTCTIRNLLVSPRLLLKAMSDPDRPRFVAGEQPIGLLEDVESNCANVTLSKFSKQVEGGDYVLKMVNEIKRKKFSVSRCDTWINGTTFFFTGHRFHIYFRLLDLYNVHKLLRDFESEVTSDSHLIRISGNDHYMFPEFERLLFPEVKAQTLEDLQNVNICFKKVVLVPKSYASPIFQCKNRANLRSKCMECNGNGLNDSSFNLFSNRVLKTCAAQIKLPPKNSSMIILISRTPYLRNERDNLKNFERVLDNENELAAAIRKAFSHSAVHIVHLENLTICEQVAYGHNADILLGVHGSGLVHLWWMKDHALVYELEPHYEVGNPTFRILSRITGRNYHSEYVGGGWKTVHSNVQSIVGSLKKYSKL